MDSLDERLVKAVLTLMDASENSGIPVVAIDAEGRRKNYFRLAISMTGRREDVDEVVDLMKKKYPNAGIQDTWDTEIQYDVEDGILKEGDA